MSDLYQLDDELYELVGDSDFTEFRDGYPFTYPVVILKSFTGTKNRVLPKFALDRLAKRVPAEVIDVDAFEHFKICFDAATEGRFTELTKSYSEESYIKYRTAVAQLVENYDSGFQENRLSTESKYLLKSFAMMLLISVEITAKRLGR